MGHVLSMTLPPLAGIVLYGFVAMITKRNNKAALIGALMIALLLIILYILSVIAPVEGFTALGWFVLTMFVGYALVGYVITWVIDSLFLSRR